jgi:hypothetical protein
MVQILESTKDFDICGGLNPGTVRVSTANSKATVISSRCAVFRPATADEFRFKAMGLGCAFRIHAYDRPTLQKLTARI